ncbi:AAA family ATPase [Weissella confusa]|uniref:Nucleotide-binding protein n=1 Tax=Weissella confusa TaxID=1583 RepID=A0A4Z0S6C7_WEICO|nr:AAA family ATPase [Weissella confusa]TGE75225.1 nucleotide-binding protein [Weissella confusa]
MQFYEAGKIPNVGNMYFVYGGKGTGKTSLAKQLPGNKLLFSYDGSTNAIADTKDIRVIRFGQSDAAQAQQQTNYWLERMLYTTNDEGQRVPIGKFGAIILDNVTALQNWVINNIENASKDGRQNWNTVQMWFRDLAMYLRDTKLPVLATAHELRTELTDAIGTPLFKPDMNDKTFNAFAAPFDVVGHIAIKNGERIIDLDPEKGNQGANRLDDRKEVKASELIISENEEEKNEEQ